MIRTYFEMGGLQLQVNSADLTLLKKACEDPEAYRQLIVRIGGYSAYFGDLSDQNRNALVERFERESGI